MHHHAGLRPRAEPRCSIADAVNVELSDQPGVQGNRQVAVLGLVRRLLVRLVLPDVRLWPAVAIPTACIPRQPSSNSHGDGK